MYFVDNFIKKLGGNYRRRFIFALPVQKNWNHETISNINTKF